MAKKWANAKIRRQPTARRAKQTADAPIVRFVDLIESLVKQAPTAEPYLRKLGLSEFPLHEWYDAKTKRVRVTVWEGGRGTAGQIPPALLEFAAAEEARQSAGTLPSWQAVKRLLAVEGQGVKQTAELRLVPYFGYVLLNDPENERSALFPHAWLGVARRSSGRHANWTVHLVDPSLPQSFSPAAVLADLALGAKTAVLLHFLGRRCGQMGEVPQGMTYIGSPADAEAAQALVTWWGAQAAENVKADPPVLTDLASVVQFVATVGMAATVAGVAEMEPVVVLETEGGEGE